VKILLVDDEQLDLFITKKLLGLEFEVEGFTSVADAVKWAATNQFDVLVSDYYLADGLSAKDVIKQISEFKPRDYKAYVLSSHVDEDQTKELKALGFSSMIEKPVSLEKFKAALSF
jgi:DNA-binding NtrC family response regulator